jgi:hypothetical protein
MLFKDATTENFEDLLKAKQAQAAIISVLVKHD